MPEETEESRPDSLADDYKLVIEFPSDTIGETTSDNVHPQPKQIDQNVVPIRKSTRTRRQPDYFECHLTETQPHSKKQPRQKEL